MFTTARTTANISAVRKLLASKPGVSPEAIYTIIALITIEKRPNVSMLTGSVSKSRSGLRKMLRIAKTITTRIEPLNVTVTPGTRAAVTITANAEIIK